MWKHLFLTLLILVIIAYLTMSVTVINRKDDGMVCKDIELIVKDSLFTGFLTNKEVVSILKARGISPVGKEMNGIYTDSIEKVLANHPLIDNAECYKTPGGKLFIEIYQRIPLLRVMSANGDNYYIDNKGEIIPSDARCVARKIIVTGNVEKSFACTKLYNFGLFLQDNPFWNSQIEQINVLPKGNIELVPRVGDHIIYLGKLNNYEEKLERLKTFYKNGLNEIGWNKYSRVNIEFNNQIVCTQRDK